MNIRGRRGPDKDLVVLLTECCCLAKGRGLSETALCCAAAIVALCCSGSSSWRTWQLS